MNRLPVETLGDRLRALLHTHGLSTEEAAHLIGVSERTLRNHISGKGGIPNRFTLRKYVEYFKCSRNWLLAGTHDKQDDEPVYLAGKTEEKVVEGARFKVQQVTPESVTRPEDVRPGKIGDSTYSDVTGSILETSRDALKVALKLMSEYSQMRDRIAELEGEVVELKRQISEYRKPHSTGDRVKSRIDQIKANSGQKGATHDPL